ncbi:MAG: HAD family phosphatase [Nanoarchaeota archaeon]|nr:HAD family phosphatase [Nanoarchaeota archaeon]
MKTYRAVIFDCGKVFLHDPDLEITLQDMADSCQLSYELTKKVVNELLPDFQTGKSDEEEFWESFKEKAELSELPDTYHGLWTRKYLEVSRVDYGVLSLVEELQQLGYKTPVLSNTIPPHVRVNLKRNFFALFEPKIFSCEVGCRKPEPEIYRLALERTGVAAAEAIFIDDVPRYVTAAQEVGIDSILFQNAQQLRRELEERQVIS